MTGLPLVRMEFVGGLTGKLLHLFDIEDNWPKEDDGWAGYFAWKRVEREDVRRSWNIPSVWD